MFTSHFLLYSNYGSVVFAEVRHNDAMIGVFGALEAFESGHQDDSGKVIGPGTPRTIAQIMVQGAELVSTFTETGFFDIRDSKGGQHAFIALSTSAYQERIFAQSIGRFLSTDLAEMAIYHRPKDS